jgi:hypothetical protein
MTTAIRKVHLANGPWAANGGWEYNAVLIAVMTEFAEGGPGDYSLDRALGIERTGSAVALGSLGLGVATAFLTMAAGRRGAPAAIPPGGAEKWPRTRRRATWPVTPAPPARARLGVDPPTTCPRLRVRRGRGRSAGSSRARTRSDL